MINLGGVTSKSKGAKLLSLICIVITSSPFVSTSPSFKCTQPIDMNTDNTGRGGEEGRGEGVHSITMVYISNSTAGVIVVSNVLNCAELC